MATKSKQHQAIPALSCLSEALLSRIEGLPPTLSVAKIAELWQKKEKTIRQQIRRKAFPLRVQSCGAEQWIALADYVKFLSDGEIQSGKKAGRKTNRQKADEAHKADASDALKREAV